MARILLVDNDAGDSMGPPRALSHPRTGARTGRVDSRRRWPAAEAGHPFVLVSPASLERRWRRVRPRAPTFCARRSTCSRTASACWPGTDRSRSPPLSASVCSASVRRRNCRASPPKRPAGGDCRLQPLARGPCLRVRAYPLSERGVVLYVRDVTDERAARAAPPAVGEARLDRHAGRRRGPRDQQPRCVRARQRRGAVRPHAAARGQAEGDPRRARGAPALSNVLFEAMTIVQESKEGMARIQRIVRDLHSFSRVDEDASVPISVNAAVESALTMLRNELRYRARVERDLRASRRCGPARPPGAGVPEPDLERRPRAARGGPQAQPPARAQLRRGRPGGRRGEDNGPGIAPEAMPRLLRVLLHHQTRGLGTGLGLPISAGHCPLPGRRAHRASSHAGGRAAVPGAASPPSQGPAAAPALPHRRRRAPSRGAGIVAIDDEALLLKAYRRMLIDPHDLETAHRRARGPAAPSRRTPLRGRALRPADARDVRRRALRPGQGALARARQPVHLHHRRRLLPRGPAVPRSSRHRRASTSPSSSTSCSS